MTKAFGSMWKPPRAVAAKATWRPVTNRPALGHIWPATGRGRYVTEFPNEQAALAAVEQSDLAKADCFTRVASYRRPERAPTGPRI